MIASVVSGLVRNMAVALMLGVGLKTPPDVLRAAWRERGLVLAALLVLELGVPLVAIATVSLVPLGILATAIIAVMAVCPGAPMIVGRRHGRVLGMEVIGLVSLLAPITVAMWVAVLDRVLPFRLAVDPGAVAKITLLKICCRSRSGSSSRPRGRGSPTCSRPWCWAVFVVGFGRARDRARQGPARCWRKPGRGRWSR